MTAPFVVFGLPRSRTKWLSVFLSYGPWVCCHDSLLGLSNIEGLVKLLSAPNTGLSETAMAFAAPVIRKLFPEVRFVVVRRRDLEDVRTSMEAVGLHYPDGLLEQMAVHLDAVSALPGTLTVSFEDLRDEDACRSVFEHCLGLPWNRGWWEALADQNIQIDMPARIAACEVALPRVNTFAADIAAMMSPVTIQEEDWFAFAPDGLPLGRRHYEEVRRDDDDDIDLNIPLIEGMAQTGLLQIVTARAGGKLVGYLVFTLSPSLVSRLEMEAVQSPFFVLPEWRGWTGLALHRESIRLLKEKGVSRLTLRSGVRGVGSRQDALFRRIGAQPDGRMWTLKIGEE
ncbi:GNAT family N-acetyltransferase [Magnetospirillum molischianum]|uniref:Uncharacterized protein n=1 Tax=Magnetospirillum molischianum DSM 120 TaxID=1150626 RepID=H8FP73_MAGML|nr:GNAT family N-acetyltransferase [Magnetospirillum molischianum]CCG40161.1 hypothetical protein PHAMO_180130 [Magnetospirillum molischianum DSM 120]